MIEQPERWKIHKGDVLGVLRAWPSDFVHCVVTSPPYWGLRDYKTKEWAGGRDDCQHAKISTGDTVPGENGVVLTCTLCGATCLDQEIGQEETLEFHIAKMVEVFREVRRISPRSRRNWLNPASRQGQAKKASVGRVGLRGSGKWKEALPIMMEKPKANMKKDQQQTDWPK